MTNLKTTFVFLLLMRSLFAQVVIYNSTPEWTSTPLSHVATGIGVADINQDGWDDVVVANGNDIYRQNLVVYYNNGDGTFPLYPSWSSGDIDYHGHLDIGDVNGDALPDVAVSVFLGVAGFSQPGHVKVYFNQGTQLESIPSFVSADQMYTFSCALGDADGDGDLDLAVAAGEPYSSHLDTGRIYYNENGSLQSLPVWKSQVPMGALDVDFADFDNNGFLDVAFACHLTPNYIFLADSCGQIDRIPDWSSADSNFYANSLTIARTGADAYPDLMISDNNQLGGHGRHKAYLFNTLPAGQTSPGWLSNSGGYGSAVLAEDLTSDNFPELISGRWWGAVEIYPGIPGGFTNYPSWSSSTTSVIEAYALRDLDKDGQMITTDTLAVARDSIHVFCLARQNVDEILQVNVNNDTLNAGTDYTRVENSNWLSLRRALAVDDQVMIEYIYSHDRDLVVSNWDTQIGNYIFYNQNTADNMEEERNLPQAFAVSTYPNPFNRSCAFELNLINRDFVKITISDIRGGIVATIFHGKLDGGRHRFFWQGKNDQGRAVSSGLYLYRVSTLSSLRTGKLTIIR